MTVFFCTLVLSTSCGAKHVEVSGDKPTPTTSSRDIAYIGPPGSVPRRERMQANEFGAYTFSSEINFCRGARWIVSGTMSSQWPNEKVPRLVRRGTRVEVVEKKVVRCGNLDERLSMVTGNLVEYRAGHERRWVRSEDMYSARQYSIYAKGELQSHVAQRRISLSSRPLPPVTIPSIILRYGYEDGMGRLFEAGKTDSAYGHEKCDVAVAARYALAAKAEFSAKNYDSARRLAFGSARFTGQCHEWDHYAVASGDGMLTFSMAEIRLGSLTAGKNDADAAAASFHECARSDKGYPVVTQSYCQTKLDEAHAIVRNG